MLLHRWLSEEALHFLGLCIFHISTGLLHQGIRDQLEGPLRMRDYPLHGLELLFHRVDGGVFGHYVPVVRRHGPTDGLQRQRITKEFCNEALGWCF